MGYETKIYLVNVHNFMPHNPKTGTEIFSLDLCKVGYDGPLPNLIQNSIPKESLFALWARPPERQQEGIEFLRYFADKEEPTEIVAYRLWEEAGRPHGRDREFWYQAEAQTCSQSLAYLDCTPYEINKLSNDLEDGLIIKDCYGDYLGVIDVDDFIEALKSQMELSEKIHRRFTWALQILESVIATWTNYKEELKIITFGH